MCQLREKSVDLLAMDLVKALPNVPNCFLVQLALKFILQASVFVLPETTSSTEEKHKK